MVIELHIRLGKETKVCITSSFNLLHLSRYCSLLVQDEPPHFVALSLPSSSWFFSGTFCWPSVTHVSSLGPDSLVTSSTNRQDKVCLLSTKYCHKCMYLDAIARCKSSTIYLGLEVDNLTVTFSQMLMSQWTRNGSAAAPDSRHHTALTNWSVTPGRF